MHKTSLRKVGGSIMLAVPPALLEVLNLQAGATVGITVESGRLIIAPQEQPRYTLHELLAQCDASAELSEDDRQWLDGERVGDEMV